MSNLGDLFYTLKLDDSQFNQKIEEAVKKIGKLGESSTIKLNDADVKSAITAVETLKKQIDSLSGNIHVNVTGIPTSATVNLIAQCTNEDEVRSRIASALDGIQINNLQVNTEAIRQAISNDKVLIKIDLDADPNVLTQIINNLRSYLNKQKVSIQVDATWTKGAIDRLESKLKKQLKELTLTGVRLDIDRDRVQKQLDSRPFHAELELRVNRSSAAEAVQGAINSANNLQNGKEANDQLTERSRRQRQVNQHATDELGIRRAINDQMKTNTMLATMFGNVIGNVFGTYAIQRFLEALIEVGGEIQKQRLALGKILQSDVFGNEIFDKMKGLAVKSPYGLLDLMKNARQLSAFGVKYNELYDTMKRLSDVAAGLGVDFGRISLAYGETMERTYLDGKLVRQMAYMGLPILQKIAKYYEEINKLGNNMPVSTSTVREMVSNKEVSFEDVKEVFKQMTDEGGQFYNMQEVMAESVAGKWKNLKDAYDIMLSAIVDGNSELLKAPAEILTSLTRNYEALVPAIQLVAVAMVGSKAAASVSTAALGNNAAAAWNDAMAQNKLAATEVRRKMVLGMLVTEEEKALLTRQGLSDAALKEALADNSLTASQKAALVIRRGLNKANYDNLVSMNLMTVAEKNAILTGNIFVANKTKAIVALRLFGQQISLATMKLQAMASAMLFNPWTAIMGAVTAGMYIKKFYDDWSEEQRKMSDGIRENFDDMKKQAESLGKVNLDYVYRNNKGEIVDASAANAMKQYTNQAAVKQRIEDLTEFIKNELPDANAILNDIFRLDNDGQFVLSLTQRLDELEKLYDKIAGIAKDPNTIASTQDLGDKVIGGWSLGEEGIITDIGDYLTKQNNTRKLIYKKIQELHTSNQSLIDELKAETNSISDSELAAALVQSKNLSSLDKFSKAVDDTNSVQRSLLKTVTLGMYRDFTALMHELVGARKELDSEFANLFESMNEWGKGQYGENWKSITEMTGDQKIAFTMQIKAVIDKLEATDEEKKLLMDKFNTECNLELTVSAADAKAKDVWDMVLGNRGQYETDKNSLKGRVDEAGKNYKQSLDDIKAYTEKYKNYMKFFKKSSIGWVLNENADGLDKQDMKKVTQALEELNSVNEARRNALKTLNEAGIDPNEFLKKTTGRTNNKDTELEKWKRQFDEIRKAYSEFQKWAKTIGKDNAGKKVSDFGLIKEDTMAAFGLSTKDLNDPKKYSASIKRFIDSISSQLTTEARKKFSENVNVEWSNVEFNISQEALKKAAEAAQMQFSDAMRKYDVWKEWFNATGDNNFASQMANSIIPVWNEKTKEMKRILEQNISGSGLKLDFGFGLSEIDMQKRFDDAGLSQYYEQWKEINKLIVDSGVQHQKDIAKTVQSLQTYSEKINVIEYNRTKDLEGVTDQYSIDRINSKYDKQIADLKPDKIAFFSAVTSMAKENVNSLAQTLKDELNNELQKGSISIEQYAKGIKEIDEQVKKSNNRNTSKTSAFIRGGRSGMVDYVREQYNNAVNEFAQLSNKKNDLESILAKNPNDLSAAEELKDINSKFEDVKKKVDDKKKDKDDIEAQEAEIAALNKFSSQLSQLAQVFSSLVESFNTIFGENSTLSAAASVTAGAANMASNISNTASQFGSSAGAAGLVAGFAIGGITSVINYNKQEQQKEEEAVKQIINLLENQYQKLSEIQQNGLGGAYQSLDSLNGTAFGTYVKKWLGNLESLGDFYDKFSNGTYAKKLAEKYGDYGVNEKYVGKSGELAKSALANSSIYEAQLAMLYGQYDRLAGLIDEESNKKDPDDSVLNDYSEQLIELEGQIETFAKDMASALYSIDFKDWASQLGQAISDAWASGQNAAEAYFETVSSLVRQSVTSAITQKYLEGIIQPLADQFIEQFSADKGQLTTESVSILAKMNNVAGEAVDAYTQALNVVEEYMNQNNNTLKTTSASNLGNSISSVTEETADLLGSYINGMRQDLSQQRIAVENILNTLQDPTFGFEHMNAIAESQLTQLRNIADNTLECANALRNLDDTLWNVVNGNKQIHVA